MTYEELMQKAIDVSKNAYIPYSKFAVGACIITDKGNTYTGCNFENASFGLTICAERNAIPLIRITVHLVAHADKSCTNFAIQTTN